MINAMVLMITIVASEFLVSVQFKVEAALVPRYKSTSTIDASPFNDGCRRVYMLVVIGSVLVSCCLVWVVVMDRWN